MGAIHEQYSGRAATPACDLDEASLLKPSQGIVARIARHPALPKLRLAESDRLDRRPTLGQGNRERNMEALPRQLCRSLKPTPRHR